MSEAPSGFVFLLTEMSFPEVSIKMSHVLVKIPQGHDSNALCLFSSVINHLIHNSKKKCVQFHVNKQNNFININYLFQPCYNRKLDYFLGNYY